MASKSLSKSYMLVDKTEDLAGALWEVGSDPLIAVDCKGLRMGTGRSGELTAINVATANKVFIFDVLELGKSVFDDGLRKILEDKSKEKLMFDCRRNADNLFHQQKVKIAGILDLQLLEVMYRQSGRALKTEAASRRSTKTQEVQHLKGFLRCTQEYVKDKAMIESLLGSKKQVVDDNDSWKRRPLSKNMKNCCYLDTMTLFALYTKLNGGGRNHSRLLVASERYANTFRCLSERTYGDFEAHSLLPLDIIPEPGDSFEFSTGSTKCARCRRRFSDEEFPETQLSNEQQYCSVCTVADQSFMFVNNTTKCERALSKLRRHKLLAVDCKGFKLWHGRSGDLTIITIATPKKVYIFDVQQLGQRVFDSGLRDILEDKTKEKLMFDCRRDADNLLHQQKVQLAGILDLQLLDVMNRNSRASESDEEEESRRSARVDDVQLLNGILRCIEVYVKDEAMIESKKRCQIQIIGDSHAWKTRPLSENLKKYCCVDTAALFILYKKLKSSEENHSRLLVASERYADTFRCWPEKAYGVFQAHPYLPLDVIPGTSDSFEFPFASTKCQGCLRLFPAEEFPKSQLRHKHRYCRVCTKAKDYQSPKKQSK
ncbi:uncharacterized protein [Argopecten irradians]|uniref:uncharacterized protein n=1 Tax=Argopecten irradians TaxID=31199 RepID=UPI003722102E